MSFKDGRDYIAPHNVKRCPKPEGTNGRVPWGRVEIGERSSTRLTTPSPLRMPLNSPPLPWTFPTFGIMEPRAGARSRVLAVISRLFGFITVTAIIEKFSRASRLNGKTAPPTVFLLCAPVNSSWSFVKLKRFFIKHELSPFWKTRLS